MPSTFKTGAMGEEIARVFLENQGLTILESRYRFERAEVDLICFDPPTEKRHGEIVFVEVKARSNNAFGTPEEAVTLAKQQSIIKAASAYLYESKMERAPCRFDVIAIDLSGEEPSIRHIRHAFDQRGED